MNIDATLAATVATVIEEGTLDAAARRLHVTPSAVSQRIKQLEEQLGQRLIVRTKPVRATAAGVVVARFAQRVALVEHDASRDLGLGDGSTRPRLAVAVNSDSLASWILPALSRFAAQHDVELDLHRDDQEQTARLLEDGTVVAAVTSRAEAVPGCRSTTLGSMTFEAMASPEWVGRWAPDGITTDALSRGPRIDFDRSAVLQLDWLRHHGVDGHHTPRHLVPSTHD
ncbi:MAG: ArgP/LysG family DNA-binding transcriptional regulator, partial [Actinomycetales bacterium]